MSRWLGSFFLLASVLVGKEQAVAYMIPQVYDETKFLRAADYFGSEPTLAGICALRTDESLAGLYFVTTFDKRSPQVKTGDAFQLQLQIIGQKEVQTFLFPADDSFGKKKEIFFGITNEDWENIADKLAAWQLTFVPREGASQTLFSSFSW